MSKSVRVIGLVTAVVFLFSVLLTGCGSSASGGSGTEAAVKAETSAQQTQAPTKEANKSTKLVVYAALNESDIVWIQKKFKEDTGIDIEYLRFGAGDAAARVQAEKASPKADILVGGSVEFYDTLATAGLLDKYSSPNAKDLAATFIDPNGFWTGWYMGVLGIVYNADRFKKELEPKGLKEPTTWDDLLNPAYKDVFLTSNPATAGGGYIFIADQLFRLGDEKGWDYLAKLNNNVHHYTPGAGDCISLVATGQFIAGMSWAHDIVKSAKQGYPIKVAVPEQTAYEIGGVSIVKGGPNADNAKKFIDWLLTKPVQEQNTTESNRYSVLKEVAPPQGMIKIEDVKLVDYDRTKASQMKADVVKKFTELIGKKGQAAK